MLIEFDRLREAYPDGNWAKMILASLNEEATGDKGKDAEKAIALCAERGVPRDVFSSPDSFHEQKLSEHLDVHVLLMPAYS